MRFTSYPCAISKFLELIFITSKSWSVVLLKEFIFITKMRKLTKRQSPHHRLLQKSMVL